MRRGVCILLALASLLHAAEPALFPRLNWFRAHLGGPATRVELRSPARISEYIAEGKLELSLRAYIELVLENNTDVAMAKLQVLTPLNSLSRALGVYDPFLSANFTNTRSTQPTTSALQGASTLKDLTQPIGFDFQQMLASGTSLTVSFDARRSSSNNSFSTYNPAFSSDLAVQFEQPLLRNRGGSVTRRTILIARSNVGISRYQLRDDMTGLIAGAENAYWDAVEARENLVLDTKFLELRKAAMERAQKQVEAGAMLPLDVFQPTSQYASARVSALQAKQLLARRENALRQQIGADLDPALRSIPLALTEPIAVRAAPLPDREEAVRKALALRPDRLAMVASLDTDDLSVKNAVEGLRPSLSVTGSYVSQGIGGVYYQRENPFGEGTVLTKAPGGFGDALGQMFGFGFPVYSFGLRLRLPLRDRAAAADLADAEIHKRRDALQLRKLEQGLRLQVLNAIDDIETLEASMEQAEVAREYAAKRFAAEQKKYELGVTQLFFVLDAQTQLNGAENDVLRQSIQYRRGLINLYVITGELLSQRGIALD